MKKLDIGCGSSKREGFLGLDCLPLPKVDVVHDLNQFPYPFAASEIDEIWMDQVLEHVNEPMKVVEEIYRICKPGAKVTIGVPYFRSSYAVIDPTHKNFFGIHWFNYFEPDNHFCKKYQYSHARYKIHKVEFDREFKTERTGFIHRTMIKIAEKWPAAYELRLSHLFPLNSLTFHLTVIK